MLKVTISSNMATDIRKQQILQSAQEAQPRNFFRFTLKVHMSFYSMLKKQSSREWWFGYQKLQCTAQYRIDILNDDQQNLYHG